MPSFPQRIYVYCTTTSLRTLLGQKKKKLSLCPLCLAHCQSKIFLFLLKVVVESCHGISVRRAKNKNQRTHDFLFLFSFYIHCPWMYMVHVPNSHFMRQSICHCVYCVKNSSMCCPQMFSKCPLFVTVHVCRRHQKKVPVNDKF